VEARIDRPLSDSPDFESYVSVVHTRMLPPAPLAIESGGSFSETILRCIAKAEGNMQESAPVSTKEKNDGSSDPLCLSLVRSSGR
jgi:hypothetical protein